MSQWYLQPPGVMRRRRWLLSVGLIDCLAVLLLALQPAVASPGLQGSVLLRVEPVQSIVTVGEEFQVTLMVEAGSQPLDTVDAFLAFDPALLQVLQLIPGATLPTLLTSSYNNITGLISYSAGEQLGGPDPSGSFALVTVRFQAQATLVPGGTPLTYLFEPPAHTTDVFYQGLSVLDSAEGGTVIVQSPPTATPTPTLTPTGSPTATPTPQIPTAIELRTLDATTENRRAPPIWGILIGLAAAAVLLFLMQRLAGRRSA